MSEQKQGTTKGQQTRDWIIQHREERCLYCKAHADCIRRPADVPPLCHPPGSKGQLDFSLFDQFKIWEDRLDPDTIMDCNRAMELRRKKRDLWVLQAKEDLGFGPEPVLENRPFRQIIRTLGLGLTDPETTEIRMSVPRLFFQWKGLSYNFCEEYEEWELEIGQFGFLLVVSLEELGYRARISQDECTDPPMLVLSLPETVSEKMN